MKPCEKLPGGMRMREANKVFNTRSGLGGIVESGKRVPKVAKRAVDDIFPGQINGGAASKEDQDS